MPNRPQPVDVSVDMKTTALLVLDLSMRCEDPKERCYQIIEPVAKFLARARKAGMFIVYTAFGSLKGTPQARMPKAFNQQDGEPVIFPEAFDKFYGGEMDPLLKARGIKIVITAGASTNQAVLYTATAAARPFGYDVVIPVDGVIARGDYEQEYSLHQFTILPNVANKFKITTFDKIRLA